MATRRDYFTAWRPLLGGFTASQVTAIDACLDNLNIPRDDNDMLATSALGRQAIAQREGTRLKAYQDIRGIWTIGVGHTPATPGQVITQAQAEEILAVDLARFELAVNAAVERRLEQHQFDALVSLAFNIGERAFTTSTLVEKLNAGDIAGAADQFLVWHRAGSHRYVLTPRRKAERLQFLGATK